MPVSICEWRVRIGTFVHWIRDYEVRERKERLLKERTRRLKVLCERLIAKRGSCKEQSQDGSESADDNKQLESTLVAANDRVGHACPHKSESIQSSDNSSSIADLLSSCDHCIKDLLTQSDSHIKNILTPLDVNINTLLSAADSPIKDLVSLTNFCETDQHTSSDSNVKDLMQNCSIKELRIPSDSCIRDILISSDSLEAALLLQNEGCRNGQHTHSDAKPKDVLTRAHFDINVIPGTDRELQTPCDSYIKDLLTPRDSLINELLSSEDTYLNESLSPGDSFISELPTLGYSFINELLSPGDSYLSELPTLGDYVINESLSPADSFISELPTPGYSFINELLSPEDSYLSKLPTPGDSFISELPSPVDSDLIEVPTSGESVINKSLSQVEFSIKELLTPIDFNIRELPTSHDSRTEHVEAEEQFCPSDSSIRIMLMPGEELAPVGLKPLRQSALISECTGNRPRSFPSTPRTSESAVLNHSVIHELENKLPRCQRIESPRLTEDMTLHHHPCLPEMLLVKAGDVELNPGPQDGSTDPRVLQESELLELAEDIPGPSYTRFCIALGFSYTLGKSVLSEHLLNTSQSLMELLCRWKVKQRDGIDCRSVLAGILGRAGLGALESKLLAGGYLAPETPPSATVQDTPRPLRDTMTEEQIAQCAEDFKNFYRERMCKIKTDPLDFNSILEFERIYTNLTLLRREMGATTNTPLDYSALLSTKINGVLPKRLLVEGEGGVGKSTFCSKMAWDWVKGSSEFQQFSWVLVIPLRKVGKGQTIGDIVKNYLSDNNSVTPHQINNYILSQPEKVLIVLDGLDEYSGDLFVEEGSHISQILRLEKFKQCRVLVTTRPWRAEDIKSDEDLSRSYAFLAINGFSASNVSTYINKYFVFDEKAGSELIQFIEINDVIRDNMAPFPIYVAMLCTLWKDSDKQRRETIRRLKTFSQFFKQLITFLKHHYVSKMVKRRHKKLLDPEIAKADRCLLQIGQIAFCGLLKRKLSFDEDDFITCSEAMETCCGIGVLSRDKQNVSRWEQPDDVVQSEATVFPHKLFQEYVAALHIASLYDTNPELYNTSINQVMHTNQEEFRYLLYFIAAQGKDIGLDIVKTIQTVVSDSPYGRQRRPNDFLVDVTFEAYNKYTGKIVGQRIFADKQTLTIDEDMSAHTLSGYLYIMEEHGMKTLTLKNRSCGPTVSRDLADILSSSGSLSLLECYGTSLNEEFYRLLRTRVSTTLEDGSLYSVQELHVDHRFIGDLEKFDVTVGDLFPNLKHVAFTTRQTVSPSVVKKLKHPSLKVLSIGPCPDFHMRLKDGEECLIPLTGDPASLGQLFSNSFPQLTSLTLRDLVIGNIRCKAILHTLRSHPCLTAICITHCFTDEELDPLAGEMSTQNKVEVTLKHHPAKETLNLVSELNAPLTQGLMDALCHRTCVRELWMKKVNAERFPDLHGREVDSKIQTLEIEYLDQRNDQSASHCLGKFVSLLPCLKDLTINPGSHRYEFYKEILDRASSSKVQKLHFPYSALRCDQSASHCLGKFVSLLPCLTYLRISPGSFHDEFYKEIMDRASSSKIQKLNIVYWDGQRSDQSASHCLGKFVSLLPCLTDLTINPGSHHEFYKEILDRASSSKIQKLEMCYFTGRCYDQSASHCLVKFVSLLPCLTDLKINPRSLHDKFYKEILDCASSSKVQKLEITDSDLRNDQSASHCLGMFVSLLPCLTDLTISSDSLHREFYKEILDCASSSKIQTFVMRDPNGHMNSDQSSHLLGRFLCLLPCLTNLMIDMSGGIPLHDEFYKEISAGASSSKNPYFRNNKHEVLMQAWSERKREDRLIQQHLQRRQLQQQLLNFFDSYTP